MLKVIGENFLPKQLLDKTYLVSLILEDHQVQVQLHHNQLKHRKNNKPKRRNNLRKKNNLRKLNNKKMMMQWVDYLIEHKSLFKIQFMDF